jgi:hypothetical protein
MSAAGDVFSVVRPEINAQLEKEMRQALAGILGEELENQGEEGDAST